MIVNRLPLSFAIALPLVFAACGGDGLTLPPEGEAAHITVMDGDGQSGRVGSTLGKPLEVQVTDTRDRPVSGATVVFSFPSAAQGEATPETTTTDSDGRASATLTLGSAPGTVTGKVAVPVDEGITPVETAFTATALSDDADGIAALSGDGQSAPVNSSLPAPLVVEVTDRFGNPIPNVTIAWTFTGGGSLSETSTNTNADGQASVTRILGATAGQQTTTATADGLAGSPVTFTHTATAGSATGVVKVSGDGQSALVGTELANPLVVQVLDAQSNPIPNRAVTWVTGDGSMSPENTSTDAQGHASTRWTLGPTPGAKTANAVVSGVGTATFDATATAGSPSASASSVAVSPATITAGGGSSTITVTVRDDGNNPVGGVSVSVSSTGSDNTISPASASTGSNGVATFTFSSTTAETKAISATAGGVAITDGATITVQKVSSLVEITSDESDPSSVNDVVTVEFTVTGSGGTPSGDVTVTVSGGTESCTGTLSAGSGSCDITLLLPGTGTNNRRVLTATYGGDARFSGDTDSENHRVDPLPPSQASTTTTITGVSPEPSDPGQEVTVSFTVTSGSGTPTGDVQVTDPNGGSCMADASVGNCTYTPGGTGTRTITATYSGNASFSGSTDTEQHTVTQPPENTAPTAADDPFYTTPTDTRLNPPAGSLTANDSPPEDGDVYSTALSAGSYTGLGSLSVSTDGTFDYTPALGFTGQETFEYTLTDGRGGSDTALVTITVGP